MAATTLYDAWGQIRASSGTGLGKYGYTGAELDAASGLYHMGARFYDPSLGRWLSEDPLGGLNAYSYAAGNPLAYVDPTGLADECATATCDPRNEAAYAATSTTDPLASYGAWLEASQSGRALPPGWERYADFALAASRQTGVSAGVILGIMAAETGGVHYNPNAIGTSGEIGLMQVMPSTAAMYGVTRAQLFDPATNISTGARYLADLLRSYEGERDQLVRAISAYNQGPGNLARNGVEANRGYWSLVLSYMDWFRRLYP